MRSKTVRIWALAVVLCLTAGAIVAGAGSNAAGAHIGKVAVSELPRQARETMALIRRGGPFRYRQDGSVFGNREHLLPPRARGYYREYTVLTPGARDRGARRIVAGGAARDPKVLYYSDDHYRSFRRIRE